MSHPMYRSEYRARHGAGRAAPWLLALLVMAGLLALAAPARAQLFSPGPLHKTHADLEGDDNCDRCHSSGKKVDGAKCLTCHDDLDRRIKAGQGLHGRAYRGQPCAKCHIEHIGRTSHLVRWPGGDKDKLDHQQTGWPLDGEHRGVGCAKCHTKRNKRGASTYLGLSTTCNSCHEDPHKGRFGTKCQECHSELGWKRVRMEDFEKKFDHGRTRFPLEGKHRSVDCKKCHGEPARFTGLKFGACSDCHEDPHKGRFEQKCESCHSVNGWKLVEGLRDNHPGIRLVGGHRSVKCAACHDQGNDRAPSKGTRCVSCHAPVHKARFGDNCQRCHRSIRWMGLPEKLGRSVHDRTRYPLEGEHAKVDCARCHPKRLSPPKRFRGIAFDKCNSCHDDRHRGEFAKRDGGDCGQCHTLAGFRPTTFGVEQHGTTAFALDGRHTATPCGACHKGKRPRLDLRVGKSTCAECHDNPHGNQFAAEMQLGGCAHCHNTSGWNNPKVDHSTWPLTGAHASARCSACHTPSEADRTTGGGATYRGVPRECEKCHRDEHAGQFRLSEPVRGCDVCHDTGGFRIRAFDHVGLANYPLTGRHAGLGCAKCHTRETLESGGSAIRYRLGYRACNDCHANPHRE